MPSFWLALFYFAPLFVFLHSLLSTRRCPPCLSLTSSHHLMPAVFVPLCHDISACTPTLLPLSPSPCNWQSSPLSSSLSALSSFLLRFPATVYIHSARPPPPFIPSVCLYPPPPPNLPPFPLICHSDYRGWQGLPAESLVAKRMNIYMNTKASSGLLVCCCLIEVSAKSLYCFRVHGRRSYE